MRFGASLCLCARLSCYFSCPFILSYGVLIDSNVCRTTSVEERKHIHVQNRLGIHIKLTVRGEYSKLFQCSIRQSNDIIQMTGDTKTELHTFGNWMLISRFFKHNSGCWNEMDNLICPFVLKSKSLNVICGWSNIFSSYFTEKFSDNLETLMVFSRRYFFSRHLILPWMRANTLSFLQSDNICNHFFVG